MISHEGLDELLITSRARHNLRKRLISHEISGWADKLFFRLRFSSALASPLVGEDVVTDALLSYCPLFILLWLVGDNKILRLLSL